jgi:hypothetical protein
LAHTFQEIKTSKGRRAAWACRATKSKQKQDGARAPTLSINKKRKEERVAEKKGIFHFLARPSACATLGYFSVLILI